MRLLLWILALGLLLPWPLDRASEAGRPGSLGARLLGPLGSLAASVEWVRFDQNLARGEYERAYLAAERALALDPASTDGWLMLGQHLIFDRGSLLLEPDPARRVEAIQAGLAVLDEGAERCRSGAVLRLIRGQTLALFLADLASQGPEVLPWPGGEGAALAEGLEDLERAAQLGHPRAHERSHDARAAAQRRAAR